jgi:SAM-dependent methyltransferase
MKRAISSLARDVSRKGAVAIDIGCGSKPYEPVFVSAGVRYLGAEFGGQSDIVIDESGKLAVQDDSSDLVLSFQVLEHVRDLATYLGEARRVLKQDGWMILSTHGTWLYHPHPQDHRRWTRPGLINEMNSHGFDVIECIPVVGPLAWTTIIRLTCACYMLRKIPVIGRMTGTMLAAIMNVKASLEDAITPQWVTTENACVYVTLCRHAAQRS